MILTSVRTVSRTAPRRPVPDTVLGHVNSDAKGIGRTLRNIPPGSITRIARFHVLA